jgi:translation elongation factor EF-Ts
MIDVMALRQFYERREITEMKWVHEVNNPADFMTKNKSFSALRTLIDINQINLDTSEWVERATTKKTVNQMTRNVQTNEWDENFRKMIRKRWFSTFQRDSSVDTS